MNQPAYRARQIRDWVNKGILDPDAMRNIPRELRHGFSESLLCNPLQQLQRQTSADGTRKYLFRLKSSSPSRHGAMVETVFIPDKARGTVCVSSQAGCVLECPFCYTGTQRFEGNLSAGEIVAQVLAVKRDLSLDPPLTGMQQFVTHIVYMGMGEPLANEKGVHDSLRILLDTDGMGLSRRRITVSTSGLIPQIQRLGDAWPVNLAISLHAASNALRNVLVPVNRKYPLPALRRCLDAYPLPRQRHITLEYVMICDVNDREEDLEALAQFVHRERERVNLIHFNPWPGSPYRGTSPEHMHLFAGELIKRGIRATVRRSRGEDIMAACGQLKAASTNMGMENHD